MQGAVEVTDSGAVLGEFCGTHQFVDTGRTPTPLRRRLVLSEPAGWQQVDSLLSRRGGWRERQRAGDHVSTFVQALAGVETGYRHGGSDANTGLSFAAGGGADVNLANWLALEVARAQFQTTRVGGSTVNGLRFGTLWFTRIGAVTSDTP